MILIPLDFRERDGADTILDEEVFAYTAQNFTKHYMGTGTYVPSWTMAGYNSNPTLIATTAAAASILKTYKTFSVLGTETVSLDAEIAILYSNGVTMPGGTLVEFGFGLTSTSTPYDWFDGAFVRVTAQGSYLVLRNNSASDIAVSPVFMAPDGSGKNLFFQAPGRKYQYRVLLTCRSVMCFISDSTTGQEWLAAKVNCPPGYGTPIISQSAPIAFRQYQANVSLTGVTMIVGRYNVRRGGQAPLVNNAAKSVNRSSENSYSQGTYIATGSGPQGQLVTTGSIVRPAAAALSNTTQALNTLTCIHLELPTLASGTDGLLMAFQNPALPVAVAATLLPARRLRVVGVRISAFVQTLFAGGPLVKKFYIAYGSTSLSLVGVTLDTVTTKAYRRFQIDYQEAYTLNQAVSTLPVITGSTYTKFANPIYVNPGEFIALVCYGTGTVTTTGAIQRSISFDYSWE